jgi:hypothetical protein
MLIVSLVVDWRIEQELQELDADPFAELSLVGETGEFALITGDL